MRVQLSQLSLPEVSVGQPRMGNDKVALVHPPGTELDDIQIQRPWSPPFGALPSFFLLYQLARLEQTTGVQLRLEENHLIQIRGLLHAAERRCFFDGRGGEQPGLGERRQRLAGSLEVPGAVAEIAA
jgi:hypothetical protein